MIYVGVVVAAATHAADIIWTNTAGGNFATAGNWSPNQVPVSSDTAWITNDGTYTITLNASATITSLMLGGSSGTQTLNHSGGTLTLSGSGAGSDHAIYNLSGGSLTGSGSLALAGSFNWTGGIIGASGATLVVAANGGLAISGATGKSFSGVTLVNNGSGTWSGGQVSFSSATFSNAPSATFDFQADGSAFLLSSGTPLIVNSGTMRKTAGAGTTTTGVRCNNSGSVQANSGTLALVLNDSSGSFSASAGNTLSVSGTATLANSSTIDGAGNFTVTSGTIIDNGAFHIDGSSTFASGSITFNGSCFITNGPLVVNGGTVTFNGSGLITPGSLSISGGNLLGSMTVTVPGLMSWTGGIIGSGSSSPVVSANGGLTISGAISKNLSGGTLINNGLATWSGGQVNYSGNAVFSNAPSATLDFQADGSAFIISSGTPLIVNAGILRKSAGTGTTTLTVRCNNTGSVQVNSGTLALIPADSSGSFSATAGNTLSLSGTATLSASASIEGTGNFTVTSGTLTNNGTFHVDGTNTFSSGTVSFNGNCFLTNGPLVINGGTVIFSGSGIIAPTLLNLSNGNLQGSMTITATGLMSWTGGVIGNSGSSLTIAANGGLAMSGSFKTFNGGTLVNNGLATWSVGQVLCNGTPVFSNAASATLDLQVDGSALIANSGTPLLANSGILRKSAGTGTTTVTVRCANGGTVQVNSGTLALTLADSSGSFTIPLGDTLSVSGTAVLSPSASVDGAGNFILTSGTLTNNGSFHVDGTNTFTAGSITFNGSSFITNNPMVINGGTVIFSGSGTVAPTLLNLSSGSLLGSMTVTVPGLTSWTSGNIGSIGSSLLVAANGSLSISSALIKNFNGGTLVNNGLGAWSGAQIVCNNSAVLSNAPSATFDLQGDGNAFVINAGTPVIVNSGVLRKSAGTGTTTVTVRCNNAGVVQVNSGTLALTLGDSSGDFAVASGTTLSVNGTAVLSPTASIDGTGNFIVTGGTITNNGALHIDGTSTFSSGTIAFNGSCFVTNGPIVVSGGLVIFNGTGSITPASLSLSSGSLLGNMTLSVSGLTTWTGTTLGSAGSSLLVIANGGLTISGAGSKTFNGGTLLNNGAAIWSGAQVTAINNAVLSNAPAALFDLQVDGSAFGTFSGNPRILNAGILRKSAGSGTTTIGIPCNNSGSVQVNSGTLVLTMGDSSGSFTVAPGNLLSMNGSATLSPSASISGAGNFTVTAGTLTNSGSYHVDGTNTFTGGTIAFSGNCVLTNAPVIVNGGIVVFTGTGTVAPGSLSLSTGSLLGSMPITISGPMTWTGATLGSAGSSLLVTAGGGLTISGAAIKSFNGGTLVNNGIATWGGGGQITAVNNAVFSNAPSALLDLPVDGIAFGTFSGAPVIINAGTLRKSAGSGTSSLNVSCTNFGLVQVNTGTLSFGGNFTQNSGQTMFNGGNYVFVTTAQLLGGTLQGSGAITGSISNNAVVSPGASPGLISLSGAYSEGPNAHLAIELGGTTAGSGYDQLSVGGKATLRGSLDVSFVNAFVPAPGNVFTVVVCNARSGVFSVLNVPTNNLGAIYTSKSVLLETGNASPVAQLLIDPFQLACHTFLLNASGSDPDGSVTNVTLLLDTNVLASAAGGVVQTSFSSDFPGDLTFTVLATDNKGASGGTNVTVHLDTLPTLMLDAVGFQTNRAFKLCMLGETGSNYQVVASDDLSTSNWLVLGTMENTNGIWRFADAAATNSIHRFYRAQRLP